MYDAGLPHHAEAEFLRLQTLGKRLVGRIDPHACLLALQQQFLARFEIIDLAAGGKVDDLEPGKKLLLECKKAGMRIYPTNEAFAQGLKSEEFGLGVMWKARVVQWQNAGISVTSMTPTEGALAYVSGFVIPKNSPNKEGAYAYLDAMLDKSAQEAFAVDMGYNPTVSNAVVAPDLNKRIGFTPDEIKKLVDLDYNYLNKNDVALKEWWDKELKG